MNKNVKKIFAGLMSTVMLCSTAPVMLSGSVTMPSSITANAVDEVAGDVIFSTSFENGEGVSEFTGRGGVEVISAVSDDAHTGDYSMCITGREKSWNGPQLLLDERCEAGVEYTVSAWAKTAWYNNINLSMEYTDSEGTRHYSNLKGVVSQGEWVEFSDIKFSFTSDVTNVYIYFECGDTADIYVDDFVLSKAPVIPIQEDIPSLMDVYTDYFDIGTSIMASNLSSPSFMDLSEKHFNESITFGNELKPDHVLNQTATLAYVEENGDDTNPQVSLSSAKSLLEYCAKNNIPVRGHTLVWHSQTPDWFFKEGFKDDGDWVSKEKMITRMENYIKNVMEALETQYPDVNIYAWDVVNEAWLDDGSARKPGEQGSSGSNNSAWVQVFGDNSFIEYAFTFARKYAPEGCKLYYNDFNEYMPQKTAAIVEMANSLKEKGLIDGIGLQSHLDVSFPSVSVYKKALASFAETGLDIQVTELDVTTSDTSEAGLETQAQYYSDIFDALVEYKDSISTVVLWGITDDQSWRASRLPLLFDAEFQAKPAFYSIIDGLEVPETSETTTTTTETTTTETTTTVSSEESSNTTTETTESDTTVTVGMIGDANEDGEVNISDVVAVSAYVSNSEKNPLSAQGVINADINGDGLNANDAFAIQQKVTGVIKSWDEVAK